MIGSTTFPRVSFGIIILNGEPFTHYCLKSLYPFAYEILVVEGANENSASIATPDGHSIDGTLETLNRFKEEEDPENKIQIITKNGFWSEKDEQSQAYAECATGDYLWQVDIDEFYKPEDMEVIIRMLRDDPEISAMSFKQITFWGGFDYIADSWYLQRGAEIYHRLFKWGKGYRYVTHRPPTVLNNENKDLRTLKWINGYDLEKKGIFLYHYSLLFPKQVREKCDYYSNQGWDHSEKACEWAENNYFNLKNPYRVHNVYNYPSWLIRYKGTHPLMINQMKIDIEKKNIQVELRDNKDVEFLLDSKKYIFGSIFIKNMNYVSLISKIPLKLLNKIKHKFRKPIQKGCKYT